jgi:N-acetylneuraminic acid mutarotase
LIAFIPANPLPQPIAFATSVPIGDSFVIVGGLGSHNTTLNTVYHYNPLSDSWTLISTMKEGKMSAIAMMVDKEMF